MTFEEIKNSNPLYRDNWTWAVERWCELWQIIGTDRENYPIADFGQRFADLQTQFRAEANDTEVGARLVGYTALDSINHETLNADITDAATNAIAEIFGSTCFDADAREAYREVAATYGTP